MQNPELIIQKYLGTPVEISDRTALNQCMDWAGQYLIERGIPYSAIRNARAYQVWTNYDTSKLQKVLIPQLGDLVVWGTQVGPSGHIAVFRSGSTVKFQSADQNWNGDDNDWNNTVQLVNHTNYGVLGYLRIKGSEPSMPYSDAQYTEMNRYAVNGIFQQYLNRPANEEDLKIWVGQGLSKVVDGIFSPSAPEYKETLRREVHARTGQYPDEALLEANRKNRTPVKSFLVDYMSDRYKEAKGATSSDSDKKLDQIRKILNKE